jgi:hypothetical protein
MSEEQVPQEIPVDAGQTAAPKPKQYLIMADELHMALLSKLLPGILFVQVEGMAMQNNNTHMLLVNPLPKAEPATQPLQPASAQPEV